MHIDILVFPHRRAPREHEDLGYGTAFVFLRFLVRSDSGQFDAALSSRLLDLAPFFLGASLRLDSGACGLYAKPIHPAGELSGLLWSACPDRHTVCSIASGELKR
jgi:hypothetical protein